jgi:diguanylate cyclase (GGDEF)-like protein
VPAFFETRAGQQLLAVVVGAMALWALLYAFRLNVLEMFRVNSSDRMEGIFLAFVLAGFASFLYSLLRIVDLRREMQRQQEQGRRALWTATHDHLTRLPNRYAFERFETFPASENEDVSHVPMATVFSIDLDGFKKVNDLLGHQGGDLLLQEVGKRLSAFGAENCVFRFGGDEFIVIARDLLPSRDARFAELIVHSLTRPIRIDGLWCQVGASVGYARWPEHGAQIKDVCHKSDVALYEAKARGANTSLLFRDEMQSKVSERAKLEGLLRTAIDTHQIRPFYQPLVDLRTGDVCGFEALARWTLDDGTSISPQMFIAIAEETGLITPLFQQLLRTACGDAKQWPDHICLSFNLSAVQMEDRLLAGRILEIVEEAGFAPERLEIEITENALIKDPTLAAAIIDDLHAAGILIALDDFGTGYSSLSQLARYAFDKIKIDQSFVRSLGQGGGRHGKIVQALLNLSRGLEVKTTVEGIEEHHQLAYFLNEGCDIGQGYLFGKAMPFDQTVSFIQERLAILRTG